MDRRRIIQAILEEYRKHGPKNQEHILEGAMKRIPDMDLLSLAMELGIDTDRVLELPRTLEAHL